MHKYLSAIGFGNLDSRKQLNKLLNLIEESFQEERSICITEKLDLSERIRYFTKDMGLMLCGTYDEEGRYERGDYVPIFLGKGAKKFDEMAVERHISGNSYAGSCEFPGIGITLIYYLQNVVEYLSEIKFHKLHKDSVSLILSGLASDGKILLPVVQKEQDPMEREASLKQYSNLIKEARAGDEDAIESLTTQEMDTYSMISKRIETEDVLSIVSTYFMPSGLECDQYSILGEILKYERRSNSMTGEKLYVMTVDCNGLAFDVCINEQNLTGVPEIGRRFKANIWLQGQLVFDDSEMMEM